MLIALYGYTSSRFNSLTYYSTFLGFTEFNILACRSPTRLRLKATLLRR